MHQSQNGKCFEQMSSDKAPISGRPKLDWCRNHRLRGILSERVGVYNPILRHTQAKYMQPTQTAIVNGQDINRCVALEDEVDGALNRAKSYWHCLRGLRQREDEGGDYKHNYPPTQATSIYQNRRLCRWHPSPRCLSWWAWRCVLSGPCAARCCSAGAASLVRCRL